MRIALDVDGVLADVMESWLDITNPGRLAPLAKSDMTSWDFWARHGIKKRDFYHQLDSCWRQWQSIPPTEPDLAGPSRALGELGDVDIVTARSPVTNRHVKAWLADQGIPYDRYVQVAAGRMKAGLDYDVYIDDSPVNVGAFLAGGKRVVLYTQPWNAAVPEDPPSRVVRISRLGQAADAIRSMLHA